jgi:hydroxymethylpyrimidine/phosphomethylpyrimidine kinase
VRTEQTFIVASVAGSDPTGGAGIQGDLKTFAAHRVLGTAVVTAITVQNHAGVREIHAVPPATVVAQLDALFDQIIPAALKTGMLHSPEIVAAVADVLARRPVKFLVVDPVFAATAGGSLAMDPLPRALWKLLLPTATLITPNYAEAAVMLGQPVEERDAGSAAVHLYRRLRGPSVLVKGGHGTGPESVDVLATANGVELFSAPRIANPNGHGTGCALSASIAARLARGERLENAIRGAKAYVGRALAAARSLGTGRGAIAHEVEADPA